MPGLLLMWVIPRPIPRRASRWSGRWCVGRAVRSCFLGVVTMTSDPDYPVDVPQDDDGPDPVPDVDPEDTLELDDDDVPGADDDDDGAGQETADGRPVG